MAGLGESCSHVGSLLWAIEAGAKKRDGLTVTQKKAYWVMPSPVNSVPYAKIKDINFKKQKTTPCTPTATPKTKKLVAPTQDELSCFFTKLSKSPSNPAILSILPGFSDPFTPKSLDPALPPPLGTLFRPHLMNATYFDVLNAASDELLKMKITEMQRETVEKRTRGQAKSKLWFKMRTGRITASKFKSACHTDPASPSNSLIMTVCHPELSRFSTEATKWGCNHEEVARKAYGELQMVKHHNFKVSDAGFYIHPEHGFLGASPDGMVDCDCCGPGVCEIKVGNTFYCQKYQYK